MSLFRRLRREKDEEVDAEKPAPDESLPTSDAPTEKEAPAPVAAASPPSASPTPVRIPPPLPDRVAELSSPRASPVDSLSQCFVCGTALEGRTCPSCRMTWVD